MLAEIEAARNKITTDSYSMSIGEIISLYQDGDLIIPETQDTWNNHQKTKFIESIFIGTPLRDIQVRQDQNSQWTLADDDINRISTILELTGDLKDSKPLEMGDMPSLPSIQGRQWQDLPLQVQRIFKRAKIMVNIVLIT